LPELPSRGGPATTDAIDVKRKKKTKRIDLITDEEVMVWDLPFKSVTGLIQRVAPNYRPYFCDLSDFLRSEAIFVGLSKFAY
jgi:hypothetical protein